MKPSGLIDEAVERWGVKLSHDQAYKAKRKAMELVQEAGFAKTCKPLIGLDACFLKGDYHGQLMATLGRDGKNQNFLIAYFVVEAETKGFMTMGLVPVVQGISANVESRLCVKNLYGNWKKKHLGLELKEVLWATARATTTPTWEREMLRMKAMKEDAWKDMLDEKSKGVATWLHWIHMS
ncbi:hypothetical protein KIW84_041420 [Lathyrus oleraceus]|uniref:MULE transposase domain-containing protein n=1 Tax=Pisum sativum TaxID=3888 RepID=A0A9D5AP89_PEA|nr:hypothetical protein KIW84_041420 [Pisum sativum]